MDEIRVVIFDWGETLMRDLGGYSGAMVSWPRVERMPGARAALDALCGRFTCCVASNAGDSDAGMMGLALARVGLRHYFDLLWTSRELGVNKPDPIFYERILESLGAPAESCVMVGDSVNNDIRPAKEIGMRTVWLAAPGEEPAPSSDRTIHHLGDLPGVIDSLHGACDRDQGT